MSLMVPLNQIQPEPAGARTGQDQVLAGDSCMNGAVIITVIAIINHAAGAPGGRSCGRSCSHLIVV